MKKPRPLIIKKSVKHVFTDAEKLAIGNNMAQQLDRANTLQEEFDAAKSDYKAKIDQAESTVTALASSIRSGFEFRMLDVEVRFRPADKLKDFFVLKDDKGTTDPTPTVTEPMVAADYQLDLLRAEEDFEKRTEFTVWHAADDKGVLVVGLYNQRWHCAFRGRVGREQYEERLDTEQKSFKNRIDAIKVAGARALDWWTEKFPKADIAPVKDKIEKIFLEEKEKVE
jgi:hypothetical protein